MTTLVRKDPLTSQIRMGIRPPIRVMIRGRDIVTKRVEVRVKAGVMVAVRIRVGVRFRVRAEATILIWRLSQQ